MSTRCEECHGSDKAICRPLNAFMALPLCFCAMFNLRMGLISLLLIVCPNVGEYTTGYVHGKASESDKGAGGNKSMLTQFVNSVSQ